MGRRSCVHSVDWLAVPADPPSIWARHSSSSALHVCAREMSKASTGQRSGMVGRTGLQKTFIFMPAPKRHRSFALTSLAAFGTESKGPRPLQLYRRVPDGHSFGTRSLSTKRSHVMHKRSGDLGVGLASDWHAGTRVRP